jgi:hypothetical protein
MTDRIFDASGWFVINNAVFDALMPALSPNAFKILCVAIRQTWGWSDGAGGRRQKDRISYSQFMEKAGIRSRTTVSRALTECLNAGFLLRTQVGTHAGTGSPLYAYRLNTECELGASAACLSAGPLSGPASPENEPDPGPENGPGAGSGNGLAGPEKRPDAGLETGLTKTQRKQTTTGGDGLTNHQTQAFAELIAFGISEGIATRLAHERQTDDIQGWLAYARKAEGVRNPQGLVVARLRAGERPPPPPRNRTPSLGFEIVNCPRCPRVVTTQHLCANCGACPDCCTCDES